MTETYLVIGATGLQGGAVAAELPRRGAKVRALADRGVTVAAGDLTDLATLPAAFEGVAGVFSVQDFYAPGVGCKRRRQNPPVKQPSRSVAPE